MKDQIRQEMMAKRIAMPKAEKEKKNQNLIDLIKSQVFFKQAKCVGIFYPIRNEVDLRNLRHEKTCVALPKIEGDALHFYVWNENTVFEKSAFGILEPKNGLIVDDEIDLLLVPALAISKSGFRIGYGKGYYDRYLLNHRPKHVVGVIYDFQEIEIFETQPHDQKLDIYLKGTL